MGWEVLGVRSLKNLCCGFVGWLALAGSGNARQVSSDGQRFCTPVLGSEAIKNNVFFLLHSPT